MKKILVSLLVIFSSSTFAVPMNEDGNGLCAVPKYKNTFVSPKERIFYENAIERAERCVIYVLTSNNKKIEKLMSQVEELESENKETLKAWDNFKLKSGYISE